MFMPEVRFVFFFFNDTATTEIYTLSLHDALPIYQGILTGPDGVIEVKQTTRPAPGLFLHQGVVTRGRSEEHTSELQSQSNLVCRLLLEKKKNNSYNQTLPVQNTIHESWHLHPRNT